MAISRSKGTPEQLLDAVKNKIVDLKGGDIESSFDYPDDLEDLETGEYESHVTEPINSATYKDMDGCISGVGETVTTEELRQMYNDMKHSDPVVSEYDTFEAWLADTVGNGYLEEVEASVKGVKKPAEKYAQVTHETIEAGDDNSFDDDPEADSYFTSLMDNVGNAVEGEVDTFDCDIDEKAIYITIGYEGMVVEFEVPLADLTYDTSIDEDYILNSIYSEIDASIPEV